jgi:CheY-like chemotaxis protein
VLGNRPILHVEDDPVDAGNLQRAFARRGIGNPIHCVPNGERALAFLRQAGGDPAQRPGIILLDLGMPVMGGLELLEQIKLDPQLRRIPVVALTASNREDERRRAYELGVAGYVVKPIEFGAFADAIGVIQRYWALCELA